jgi:putative exporter of polyketide antibiotics
MSISHLLHNQTIVNDQTAEVAAAVITQNETGEMETGQTIGVVAAIITGAAGETTEDGGMIEGAEAATTGEVAMIEDRVMTGRGAAIETGTMKRAEIMVETEAGPVMIRTAGAVGEAEAEDIMKRAAVAPLAAFLHRIRCPSCDFRAISVAVVSQALHLTQSQVIIRDVDPSIDDNTV